ncbi:hypothetical protein [Haloactinopolyspora sp.]|uniref:hypothetical protein n=1 Tax=Haloactinopolyspora sp. TaxID=1966353 RepID=UPI002637EC8F|nr:hypothetical protein [Haloactinopolyspora sp.]
MSIPDQSKLNEIGRAMVASAPDGWHLLTLEVTAAGDMIRGRLYVTTDDSSPRKKVRMDEDGVIAASELREDMYQEQTGTWYNATFQVAAGGEIRAEFDYENAPYGGIASDDSEGEADPELLIEDQELYPRSPEHLPAWHPARAS